MLNWDLPQCGKETDTLGGHFDNITASPGCFENVRHGGHVRGFLDNDLRGRDFFSTPRTPSGLSGHHFGDRVLPYEGRAQRRSLSSTPPLQGGDRDLGTSFVRCGTVSEGVPSHLRTPPLSHPMVYAPKHKATAHGNGDGPSHGNQLHPGSHARLSGSHGQGTGKPELQTDSDESGSEEEGERIAMPVVFN